MTDNASSQRTPKKYESVRQIAEAIIRASTRDNPFTMKKLTNDPKIAAQNPPHWVINEVIKKYRSKNTILPIKEPGVPRGTYYYDPSLKQQIASRSNVAGVNTTQPPTTQQSPKMAHTIPGIRTTQANIVSTETLVHTESKDHSQPASHEESENETSSLEDQEIDSSVMKEESSFERHDKSNKHQTPPNTEKIDTAEANIAMPQQNQTRITLELQGIRITIESLGQLPDFKIS